MEKIKETHPPRGIARLAFRAPIWLYRLGLGGLLGKRFLRLIHTGRKSGLARQTVLEVIQREENTNTYFVASGYGEKSDWCRNITKNPCVTIQVGSKSWVATASRLTREESEALMVAYGQRVPFALVSNLAQLMGYRIRDKEEDYRALGRILPIFALIPVDH